MSDDHADQARRLRHRAEECRSLAKLMTDKHAHQSYLKLAQSYELLATKEEQLRRDILKPPVRKTR
jgi:hypothetical protein